MYIRELYQHLRMYLVESVSEVSYTTLEGRWCDVIVLNT